MEKDPLEERTYSRLEAIRMSENVAVIYHGANIHYADNAARLLSRSGCEAVSILGSTSDIADNEFYLVINRDKRGPFQDDLIALGEFNLIAADVCENAGFKR